MYRLILIKIIYLAAVSGHQRNSLYFSQTKTILSECIAQHREFNDDQDHDIMDIKNTIVDLAGEKFAGQFETSNGIENKVALLIDKVRSERQIQGKRISWKQLEINTVKALLDCYDDSNSGRSKRSNGFFNFALPFSISERLPSFIDEPTDMATILDYMLVDWPEPLHEMIRTRNGRALLRNYADNAELILNCALEWAESHDYFRVLIRVL